MHASLHVLTRTAAYTPTPSHPSPAAAGNRPSTSLLLPSLSPFRVGQLLALYENRVATQVGGRVGGWRRGWRGWRGWRRGVGGWVDGWVVGWVGAAWAQRVGGL